MNRRAGLSLAEVLIAIFVLALGLLGVLSLFPLGAVRMAQAIKDDRTATLHNNFASTAREYWKEETADRQRQRYPVNPAPSLTLDRYDPIWNATENVNYPYNPDLGPLGQIFVPSLTTPAIPRNYHGASYPVFVDAIGWGQYGLGDPNRYWVGGNTQCIPRRSLRRVEYNRIAVGPGQALYAQPINPAVRTIFLNRYFVLLDDLGFNSSIVRSDGTPTNASGTATANNPGFPLTSMLGEIQRDGRYNCSFMLQREDTRIFREATMTIVVYGGRSLDTPAVETAFSAIFIKGSTEAFILYNGAKPNLRKGNWILDGTMSYQLNNQWYVEPHGFFYRIINVTDDTLAGISALRLELQDPARMSTVYPNGNPYGIAVVMENVVEVFSNKALTENVRPVP